MGNYGRNVEVALVVVLVAAMMMWTDAAISCGTVSSKLSPCLPYLVGQAPAPSGGCCGGVKGLYQLTAGSRPDRITTCNCIKQIAGSLGNKLNGGAVGDVASKCGVNLGYRPSLGTACNSIP